MNKNKILIVENEAIIALDIQNTIKKLNYHVTNIVSNHDDVIESIEKNEPDIILMDIQLDHDKDGIDIVKSIYETKYIPIIYLTGSYDDETINRAIKTDPIGYLLKPFNAAELKAAILLGLSKNDKLNESLHTNHKYLGFEYYFDEKNKKLYHKDHVMKLGTKEIKLLNLLVEANGESVSFETIDTEVWEDYSVSNDAIRTLVYRLRTKMNYKLITSVPFFGFKL